MDEFSKEVVVFSQTLSCSPLCSPHHASLLTGKYPMSTGVYTNCKVGADVMLQPDEVCISDVLKQEGYETGYIGKWHLDLPEKNISDKPESGAEGWDAYTQSGPKRHGFDYWYSYGAWDDHLSPHYWQDILKKVKVNQWSVEHETDKVFKFIKNRNDEQPFAQVPERYKNLYEDLPRIFR